MKFGNLKIGVRLAIAFALVLGMLAGSMMLALSRMSEIQKNLDTIVNVNNVEIGLASAMRMTVYDRAVALRNVVLLTEPAEMEPEAERAKHDNAKYREL